MRLTEQSRYALRVLAHCAERHPALAKVATIAAVTGITEQNIFKLIKTLSKAGFVETNRGPHGGVRLAKPPAAIRVGQVIRAIEPRFRACGPTDAMLSEEPVSPVERELDRSLVCASWVWCVGLDVVVSIRLSCRVSADAALSSTTVRSRSESPHPHEDRAA